MATNSMDDNYWGTPFVMDSTDPTETIGDMDTNYWGTPFVYGYTTEPPPVTALIKEINYTLLTNIKSILGVPVADFKSYGNVDNQ